MSVEMTKTCATPVNSVLIQREATHALVLVGIGLVAQDNLVQVFELLRSHVQVFE